MGYVLAMGPCVRCRRVFAFNAELVPSMVVEGTREPICADCVEALNPIRAGLGLPPIVPLPGAYEGAEA